jgi:hypothetical protein
MSEIRKRPIETEAKEEELQLQLQQALLRNSESAIESDHGSALKLGHDREQTDDLKRQLALDKRYDAVVRYEAWQYYVWLFTLLFLAAVGVAGTAFLLLHDPPLELRTRKLFFAAVYVPLYVLLFVLVTATRNYPELNDVVSKATFSLLGSAITYIFLSSFNVVMLALDMS